MSDFLIIHVSDLHFGQEIYPPWNPAGAPTVHKQPPLASRVPNISQKLFPHSFAACEDLANLVKIQLRIERPRHALLIASGDLTATGDDSEFVNALTFLRGQFERFWSLQFGLGGLPVDVLSVPGNHDHWNGRPMTAWAARSSPTPGLHEAYFPGGIEPWWHRTRVGNGLQLQVMGLDSCGASTHRWAARGVVDPAHLSALVSRVDTSDQDAIRDNLTPVRVLVMHHPPTAIGLLHALDAPSQQLVKDFCDSAKIHFVLTGHTHEPVLPTTGTPWGWGNELRCGTTLQGAPPGQLPTKAGNTLLMHSLSLVGSDVRWQSRVFQRQLTGGFRLAPSLGSFAARL